MNLGYYGDFYSRHGATRLLVHGAARVAYRATKLIAYHALAAPIERLDSLGRDDSRAAEVRNIGAGELRPYADEPANDTLADPMFDVAAARGDRCFACFEGRIVTHYGLYAVKPTLVMAMERKFLMRFDPSWVYVHSVFTLPSHRGRRLHGLANAVAARSFRDLGVRGFLALVAMNNFASLKTFYRLGFRRVGNMLLYGATGGPVFSPGCRDYGIALEAPAS